MDEKYIWVVGTAVQDITLDLIDHERLMLEHDNLRKMIRLDEKPRIASGLWLKTQYGLDRFAVKMVLEEKKKEEKPDEEGFYSLSPGSKYSLADKVYASWDEAERDKHANKLFVPCESMSWGGGGLNCTKFLRSLVPNHDIVPIRYSDIAMSRTLRASVGRLQGILKDNLSRRRNEDFAVGQLHERVAALMQDSPDKAEVLTSEIANMLAEYSPVCSLEAYLASLPVEFLLYRPESPRFRRNLVFSRFRSVSRQIDNKIICRGRHDSLPAKASEHIRELLAAKMSQAGAILLNSVQDLPLFQTCYSIYKEADRKGNNIMGVFGITTSMEASLEWMMGDKGSGKFPPFILVFNENEALGFARKLKPSLEPFLEDPDDLPNIQRFSRIAQTIRTHFEAQPPPRLYVTIGSRGSLGVDRSGHVVYVYRYNKPGAVIYDTNMCGDAYCAAITLLEWAKRHKHLNISGVDLNEPEGSQKEMEYFMAFATAVSYAKATSRRGRVDVTEVKDLFEHLHLATRRLAAVAEIAGWGAGKQPEWVTKGGRLQVPSEARAFRPTEDLRKLLG
jgi:hypothetical protein